METVDAPLLFDSAFLSKLEQLYLLSKKLFRGEHRAERPSRQIGASLEFADYRNYVLGDDLRSIDWNVYGRLDRLFLKLFEEEQDLHIYFLVDDSASMRWKPAGEELSKFDHARRITAALAYVALANLDRVNVQWFGQTIVGDLGLARGKAHFHKVLDFLRRAPEPDGPTSLSSSMRTFAQRTRRRGLAIVLSDFFDPAGFEEALSLLKYNRFDLHVIQVLDPAELDPRHTGDLRLVEPESGETLELTSNDALIRRYRDEMDAFLAALTTFCHKQGIAYARATTAVPFEDLVLRVLRDGLLLK